VETDHESDDEEEDAELEGQERDHAVKKMLVPRPPALEEKIAASRLERQKASTRKKAEKGRIRSGTETDEERAIRHKKTAARLLSKSGFMTHTDGTEIRTVDMNFLGKALSRQ
jgi:hypothetical protein